MSEAERLSAAGIDLDAWKQEIMTEVESKVLESVWRRGQSEIKKLQQEEENLVTELGLLREQQELMRKESLEMQAALAQVTDHFEVVVRQMREAFRLMPQLSGIVKDDDLTLPSLNPNLRTPQTPEGPPGLESRKATPSAPVLSLASALPATPSAPSTRLQLAEILPDSQPATPRETLQVTLCKEPGFTFLGMDVKPTPEGMLRVASIAPNGLVCVFNARQAPHQRIMEGDRISEVNGVKSDTDLMLAECKSKQQLVLTLQRAKSDKASMLRPDAEAFVPSPDGMGLLSPPGMDYDFRGLQSLRIPHMAS